MRDGERGHARDRGGGGAPQLRQAGRLSRGAHAATSRPPRTRCPMPSPPPSPTGMPAAFPTIPRRWLLTVARRRAVDAARRRRSGEAADPPSAADRRGTGRGRRRERPSMPDHRLALMFACAHPAHRSRHPRAADPADHPRLRCRDHRLGLPGLAGRPWASAWCAPRARSGRPAFRSACPSAPTCASASTRCWRRSTPPSPKAGPIPPAPKSAAATSPKKRSGSAGWWPRCCRTSPRRSACWR